MTPILFFAAGKGTRMRHLTHDKPKPLVQVGSKTLLDHALDLSDGVTVGPRVVNLHYKGDMIRDHLIGTNILFSDERDKLLETGGGLRHALPLLNQSPAITMNTDAVWNGPNPIAHVLANWHPKMEALLLLVPKQNAIGHAGVGDFKMDTDGRLQRGAGNIYTGLQMIRTETLDDIQETEFSMNVVWDQMIARGGVFGTVYDGRWCDVGQPQSIPLAEAMIGYPHV